MTFNYARKYRCVYILIDPRDGNVFYVGQTCMPEKRLQEHLISAEVSLEIYPETGLPFGGDEKDKYIVELWSADGRDPEIKVIIEGQYTYNEICKLESQEIESYCGSGALLTNRSLTKRAVDLRESAASQALSTLEFNLVGGADTTPPANH